MRIIRYLDSKNQARHGIAIAPETYVEAEGDLCSGLKPGFKPAEIRKILAPLVPSQIFGIGLNYRKHAEETNAAIPRFPVLFFKNAASVQNPGDPILIPTKLKSSQVDYECELAVVIGKAAKNVSKAEASKYILGYTIGNDVSARDWQKDGGAGQWCRGKSFDTFTPLGPVLFTADEVPNPNGLNIKTILNGETMQDSNTSDMIFDIPSIIEFLSASTTLLPGTVILTGTPSGVGMARNPQVWMKPGDTVTVEIEGLGSLTNPVALE